MPTYQGSCHCGAVHFSFSTDEAIDKGLRCNCSICARKGAIMSQQVFKPEDLHIQAAEDALGLYQFGAKTAKHFFCKHCGIYPFHETARMPGFYRVNLGCIDELDSVNLPFEVFDGRHKL
jgi:hypothetical protein